MECHPSSLIRWLLIITALLCDTRQQIESDSSCSIHWTLYPLLPSLPHNASPIWSFHPMALPLSLHYSSLMEDFYGIFLAGPSGFSKSLLQSFLHTPLRWSFLTRFLCSCSSHINAHRIKFKLLFKLFKTYTLDLNALVNITFLPSHPKCILLLHPSWEGNNLGPLLSVCPALTHSSRTRKVQVPQPPL